MARRKTDSERHHIEMTRLQERIAQDVQDAPQDAQDGTAEQERERRAAERKAASEARWEAGPEKSEAQIQAKRVKNQGFVMTNLGGIQPGPGFEGNWSEDIRDIEPRVTRYC